MERPFQEAAMPPARHRVLTHRPYRRFVGVAAVLLFACLGHRTVLGQDFRSSARSRTVSGVVLDSVTGEPVVGADVSLRRSFRMQLTDSNGRFAIAGVEDGPDELRVRRMGYVAATVPVNVREGMAQLTVLLVPEPLALDSLEVAARRGRLALAGIVIDSLAGTPVAHARVRLQKSERATRTDRTGRFSATVRPDEVIIVDALGYLDRTVTLPSPLTGEVFEIRVLPDTEVLPAVPAILRELHYLEVTGAQARVWDAADLANQQQPNVALFLWWQTIPGGLIPDSRIVRWYCGGSRSGIMLNDTAVVTPAVLWAIPITDVYQIIRGADLLSGSPFTAIYTKSYLREKAKKRLQVADKLGH